MRRLKNALLVAATLLLVAAGAAMPGTASYLLDAYGSRLEERVSFDSFFLTLRQETDLGRTLKLIAGSDYYVEEATASEEASLNEWDTLDAAREVLAVLSKYGLLESIPEALTTPEVWPQTIISSDETISIPMWNISWPDSPAYIWLDDGAGKAVMISIPCMGYSEKYLAKNGTEPLYVQAENWRAFLEEYYGTNVQITGEEWFDTAARFALTFPLGGDGEKSYFQLDLYLHFLDGFATLSPYISPFGGAAAESPPPYDSSYDS